MVRRRRFWGVTLSGALALGSIARELPAQTVDGASRAAARDLGYAGIDLLQKGDAAAATERLERAYQVLKVPSIGLWSARALVASGKLVEGSERYLEVSRLPSSGDAAIQEAAKTDAAREHQQLAPRIPALIIKVNGAAKSKARVVLDGVEVPAALLGVKRPVNPGRHRLRASASAAQDVTVKEGEVREVLLQVAPGGEASAVEPTPTSSEPAANAGSGLTATSSPAMNRDGDGSSGATQRLVGWVLLGVGGAGLITGGVATGLALSKKSSIEGSCPDNTCLPDAHDGADSYNGMRSVSTVGFVVGAVGAAAGVTLLLTAPSSRRVSLELRTDVHAASLRVKGAF